VPVPWVHIHPTETPTSHASRASTTVTLAHQITVSSSVKRVSQTITTPTEAAVLALGISTVPPLIPTPGVCHVIIVAIPATAQAVTALPVTP
jgi:hypothetical protein